MAHRYRRRYGKDCIVRLTMQSRCCHSLLCTKGDALQPMRQANTLDCRSRPITCTARTGTRHRRNGCVTTDQRPSAHHDGGARARQLRQGLGELHGAGIRLTPRRPRRQDRGRHHDRVTEHLGRHDLRRRPRLALWHWQQNSGSPCFSRNISLICSHHFAILGVPMTAVSLIKTHSARFIA